MTQSKASKMPRKLERDSLGDWAPPPFPWPAKEFGHLPAFAKGSFIPENWSKEIEKSFKENLR